VSRGRAALGALDRFARIHFAGFTSLWALLGAASSGADPSWPQLLGLVAVSLCFHLYGAVMNDVMDLEIDASQPLRAGDPLVSGSVSRGAALAFALAQLPLAFALTAWLGGAPAAFGWLALAALAMAVYNGFGKRAALPPATDLVQGVCWAALVLFGAVATGAGPGPVTLAVALYAVLYTTLINGVHGGMRDLANDFACGARTTALWLGVRPGRQVPRAAWIYCGLLQAGLVLTSFAAFVPASAGLSAGRRAAVGLALLALNAVCVHLLVRTLQPRRAGWERAFRLHLGLLLFPVLAAVLVRVAPAVALAVVAVFFVPLLLLDTTRGVLAAPAQRLGLGGPASRQHRGAS
jgi:4-hydroxybenzoate polyprenyltransferase